MSIFDFLSKPIKSVIGGNGVPPVSLNSSMAGDAPILQKVSGPQSKAPVATLPPANQEYVPSTVTPPKTFAEIAARKESISATPKKFSLLPEGFKDWLSAGLLGKEEIGPKGAAIKTKGLLEGLFPGVAISEFEKFENRKRALLAEGNSLADAENKALELTNYGRDNLSLLDKYTRKGKIKATFEALPKAEQSAIRKIAIFEGVSKALDALNFVGIGSIGGKTGAKIIAETAEKSLISKTLRKEIPSLSSQEADAFSDIFRVMNDETEVQSAINKIKLKKEGFKESQGPLQFLSQPVSDVVPSVAPKASVPELLSKPVREVVSTIKTVGTAKIGDQEVDIKKGGIIAPKEARTTPLDAETAASTYYNEKLKPEIDAGGPTVLGADDLKDYFGNDYNDVNHPIYSKATFDLYEKALKESKGDTVMFTGGGAGSGKTDFLISPLKNKKFNGIIYDSNLSNFEGAKKQIEMARQANKKILVTGIIADLEKAHGYTLSRQQKTGRGISTKTFARGHAGFPAVAKQLLKDGILKPEEVKIFDLRNIHSPEDVRNMIHTGSFNRAPLALLEQIRYTEEELQAKFKRDEPNKQPSRLPQESGDGKSSVPVSGADWPDTKRETTSGGRDRRVFRPEEGINRAQRQEIESALKERTRIDVRFSKENLERIRHLPFEEKLDKLVTSREILKEALAADPAQGLKRYISNTTGRLPEVTGKPTMKSLSGSGKEVVNSQFGMSGDDIVKSLGYKDVSEAQEALDNLLDNEKRLESLQEEIGAVRAELAASRLSERDTRSLDALLNKTAKENETQISKQQREQERQKRVKEAADEGQRRAIEEQQKEMSYGEKIKQAHKEARKRQGFFAKLKQFLRPINSLDNTTKEIVTDWKIEHDVLSKELAQADFEANRTKGPQNMQEVLEFQAGKNTPYIKEYFDSQGTDFKREGLEFEWLDDYLPQVYQDSPKKMEKALREYLKDKGLTKEQIDGYLDGDSLEESTATRLKLRPNFVKERFWPDYQTAMKYGLKPKYRSPAQLIGYYREQGEKALANKRVLDRLKEEAKLLPSEDAPDTWEHVTNKFSRADLYASPELARFLNGKFRGELNAPQVALENAGKLSKFLFTVRTMAGVPYTTVNSFAIGQANKMLTSFFGDIAALDLKSAATDLKAMWSFVRANSKKASRQWFEDNKHWVAKASKEGLQLARPDLYEDVGNKFSDLFTKQTSLGNWLGIEFKKAFESPTTKNMLAQINLTVFRDTYLRAAEQGLSDAAATKLAKDTTVAFGGLLDDYGRGGTLKDAIDATFSAPYFREGVLQTLWNGGKSYTSDFRNRAYLKSRRFVLGLAIAYGLYNALNKHLNGNYMWENPPGHEWQLRIPRKDGEVVYLTFMPSFLAIARNLTSGAINLAAGNYDTAKQKFGSVFSVPVQVTTEIMANKDYFGRQIYKETDTAVEKNKKIAEYLGMSVNHPFVSEPYRFMTGKQPLHQTLVRMAELPTTFGTTDKESAAKYYDMLDEQSKERTKAKSSVQKIYEKNQKLKAEGKTKEADAEYNKLTKTQKELYQTIKTTEKRKLTTKRKPAMQALFNENQLLIKNGDKKQAVKNYLELTPEDKHVYDLVKKASLKNYSEPVDD